MKEKINDGINVAECTYSKIGIDKRCYCEEHLYNDGTPVFKCKEEKDCYFKQLQRLKQENEKLKAMSNEIYNNTEQIINKYNKYDGEKENELVEVINKTTDKKNKYKQALEEIREIIQKCEIENIPCVQCNERERCDYDLIRFIITKIDEVLSEK